MAAEGGIVAWLIQRGYWLRKGDAGASTHLSLVKGRARVPDAFAAEFVVAYANAIVRGDTPSLAECRTPVFRLYMDLDIEVSGWEDAASTTKIREVLGAIAGLAPTFFDCEDCSAGVVVLRAPSKPCGSNVKCGIHLVWPDVYVDAATALAFRARVVEHLTSTFGKPFANEWAAVVDPAVYVSTGLRMPWSHKKGGEARPYVPAATIVPGGGWLDVDLGPKLTVQTVRAWLRRTVIRAPDATLTRLQAGVVVDRSAPPGIGARTSESLARFAHVLPALEDALPTQYTGQKFTSMVRLSNSVVLRSSSRYCENLGGNHKVSNVYFLLTRRGVCQKCYCRNEKLAGRKYGSCSAYRGPTRRVPQHVIDAFFKDEDELEMVSDEDSPGSVAASKGAPPSAQTKVGGDPGASTSAVRRTLKRKPEIEAILNALRLPWEKKPKKRGQTPKNKKRS